MEITKQLKIRPIYALGFFELGELYADRGEKEKALENLKKAERMYEEMGLDYWLNKAREVLARLEGIGLEGEA